MLNIILIAIGAIVGVFIVVVSMRPADFSVMRSINTPAPPATVFAQVNELKKWEAWNPWGKIDPAMKLTYEGPSAGTGASYRWVGNNQVGEGSMTITESRPGELVRFRLDFLKPFKGTSMAEFTFKTQGSQTAVTWSMSGKNNFMAKAVGLFMDCDKMIGSQFEKGLTDLKSVAEAAAKK